MKFEHRVDIDAPTEAVWSVMADLARWPSWNRSIDTLEVVTSGGLEPGAQVHIKQPKFPAATWTVTDVTSGRSFTWEATSPGVRTIASHVVADRPGGGCSVTLTLEQHGVGGILIGLVSARLTRRYLSLEATGLTSASEHLAHP